MDASDDAASVLELIRTGRLKTSELAVLYRARQRTRRKFGRLAVEAGLLTMRDVFAITSRQADLAKPFGEVAIELGLLTHEDVECILNVQLLEALSVTSDVLGPILGPVSGVHLNGAASPHIPPAPRSFSDLFPLDLEELARCRR